MRVIQSAVNEVKAIQPSAAQDLLTLLPPGSPHSMLQMEPEAGGPEQAQGQGVSSLQHGQEKLHLEGKTALHTLSCTREALREAMERELQEQRERRAHSRAFFGWVTQAVFKIIAGKFVYKLSATFLHLSQLFVFVPVVSV